MKDIQCVEFLQWVLPRLRLRWPGFRKVRKQVCKRLQRRLQELQLADLEAYRGYLAEHPSEWRHLDALCRISISRFFRDRGVFEQLASEALPLLIRLREKSEAGRRLRIWCAGCASGEEPYTLRLIWHFRYQTAHPDVPVEIIATDLDPGLLERARTGCYPENSLKDLPGGWRDEAFAVRGHQFCLRPELKNGVQFHKQDLREEAPAGPFHLIACRNLAFTYFAEPLQREVLARLEAVLQPGGLLVIGSKESLPAGSRSLKPFAGRGLFQKISPDGEKDSS